jgi:hypothetical protein
VIDNVGGESGEMGGREEVERRERGGREERG